MINIFTRRKRPTHQELEFLRHNRSMGIRRVLGVSGLIFLALVAFLASMLVLPPMLELQNLQREKELVELRLQRAQNEESEAHNRYIWMMDPEYFEQIARDRANQAKEGETVIRRPHVSTPTGNPPPPARRN